MSIFGMPVIDVCVHTGFYINTHYRAEHLLELIQRHNLNFCLCASYTSGIVGQAAGTAETRTLAERHPERIGGLVWVVPLDPGWEHDATQALYAGFYGIYLHPEIDCYTVNLDLLRPVFQFAQDHAWPVIIRMNEKTAQPAHLTPIVNEFADVPLVLFSLSGLDELALAAQHTNVFICIGGARAETILPAARAIGAERLVWGSGAPAGYIEKQSTVAAAPRRKRNLTLIPAQTGDPPPQTDQLQMAAERYTRQVRAILDTHLPEPELEAILFSNARRIFGLDQLRI